MTGKIITPIRAKVRIIEDDGAFGSLARKVLKETDDFYSVLADLTREIEASGSGDTVRKWWNMTKGMTRPVGYFVAEKQADGKVRYGYCLCHPKDLAQETEFRPLKEFVMSLPKLKYVLGDDVDKMKMLNSLPRMHNRMMVDANFITMERLEKGDVKRYAVLRMFVLDIGIQFTRFLERCGKYFKKG
jgi:hypothetical protein